MQPGNKESQPLSRERNVLEQAIRELPAAVSTLWRYLWPGLLVYFCPFWNPFVLGTAAMGENTVSYARLVAVGFFLLETLLLIMLVDRVVDIDEDRELHPERTEAVLQSYRGMLLLINLLLLAAAITVATMGGLRFVVMSLLVALAFGSFNFIEPLLGKPAIRMLASAVFGGAPFFISYGLHLEVPPPNLFLAFVMIVGCQLSTDWWDDAGDYVKSGDLEAADRWLQASAGGFALGAVAGLVLLYICGGAWVSALGLLPVALACPFANSLRGPRRHQHAANLTNEPWLELRWSDGSSWRPPIWLDTAGFTNHVFLVVALAT